MMVRTSLVITLLVAGTAFPAACDSGSTITFTPDDNQCHIIMERNSDGFAVEMTLQCNENGEDCFVINDLRCQDDDKSSDLPIDLKADTDGCPDEAYCVRSCEDGLEAPGALWDMPSLQAVDGCNVYDDGEA